jgi:hypothetical protein
MSSVELSADLSTFAGLLNQTLRRLKQYGTESEWVTALLDGVSRFTNQAAIFAAEGGQLRLRGAYQLNLPDGFSFPMGQGRAFETAIDTKDPVVALRTPGEVTAELSSPDAAERALVIPIWNGDRIVALLFAGMRSPEQSSPLELVSGMASLALERRSNGSLNVQISPAPSSSPSRNTASVSPLHPWSTLGEEHRILHLRAQRFSRVKVAEMQLYRPEACRAGREQNNVYLFLKKEIDAARDSYVSQFMARPGMEDYLHRELIRIAADGDEMKLGVDYPGQLG